MKNEVLLIKRVLYQHPWIPSNHILLRAVASHCSGVARSLKQWDETIPREAALVSDGQPETSRWHCVRNGEGGEFCQKQEVEDMRGKK